MNVEQGSGKKPPFVLVHGAFHGGWCWGPVARILRSEGHAVFTPTQTGLGERRHLMSSHIDMETFVLDVLNVLEFEELSDVVLVGHSYGARSISGVADRRPDLIRRLIYIDGGLALNGKSRLEAMPEAARQARIAAAQAFDGGTSVPPPPASHFDVHDPNQAAWLERHLTPQPLSAERTAVALGNPIGNGCAVTYLRCTDPAFAAVEPSAVYARAQQDWRYLELPAGHNAIVTHVDEVAQILLREAMTAA